MTARLPEEPVRVTNWLAGWLDYVFATVMTAGRWFRLPVARGGAEPVMLSAFAPTMDSYGHSAAWNEGDGDGSGRVIRILEIGMLSVSFFLAAHLLSGGTPTVSAPNLGAFQAGNNRVQAAALAVPGAAGKEVIVDANRFAAPPAPAQGGSAVGAEDSAAALATTEAQAPATEESAVLAPAPAPDTAAAAVEPPASEPETAPAATQPEPPPPPPPAAAAPDSAAGPPATTAAGDDRYLTVDELHAAALAAGWPAALLPELEIVARCESSFRTHAQYLGAQGLMQMMPFWFVDAGVNPDLWWEPVTNLRAAKHAYDTQIRLGVDGWGPWTCKP